MRKRHITATHGADENTADLFTKVLKRQPFEKHRKVVLNSGAGESTDEVKQQRLAALSAWETTVRLQGEASARRRGGFLQQNEGAPVPAWRACVWGYSRLTGLAWIVDPGGQ